MPVMVSVASKQRTKGRTHQVQPLIQSICNFAYQSGIPAPALVSLVDIVTSPNHLGQASTATLIKGLYPTGKVPQGVICTIINSLGTGQPKPAPSTQNLLLRWLVLVYEVLDDHTTLVKLYSVLFNLLDMISIRANLCHLLSILTRRKHVKPFRIQFLLELSRSYGNEPAVLGLLKVYKKFYPDVIVNQSVAGKPSIFEYPDPEWRDQLRLIQDANLQSSEATQLTGNSFKVLRRGVKRSRVAVVPEVLTLRADESSITIEEIDGVDDFVENLEKITLPSQLISALDDPLLRNYLVLRGSDLLTQRIDDWLSLFFDTQLKLQEHSGGLGKALVEVLEKSLSHAHYTKAIPSSVNSFLAVFLDRWDGIENRTLVLDLLAYLPLQDFEELQRNIMQKLETSILDNTPESSGALLGYYTSLLRHWTSQFLSISDSTSADVPRLTTAFTALTDHASLLSLSLLASFPPTQATISTVLSYHEALAYTISHATTNPQIRILTPLTSTIYLLVFLHPSLSTLSRLCSLLATYKRTFESTMLKPPPGIKHEYPREYINHFNGFLMDICNLLWRSRAFNNTDTNALGCLIPTAVLPPLRAYVDALAPPQPFQSLFSLSHNPSLSALSAGAFRDLEDRMREEGGGGRARTRHTGPVTQRSLEALAMDGGLKVGWADYRLEVLKWLGNKGVDGIGELMFCTMKHLMAGKGT